MIERLIHWCVAHRVLVLLVTLCVAAGGVWSIGRINVDAIPDLSDVQVIITADHPGQAPQIVEQQVTYPLTTTMLSVSGAQVVRGYSMFGTSFVHVIFDDGTDPYWARSRVLEQLSVVAGRLPPGVTPQLGPDATGVGWVFQYALVTGRHCADHPAGHWHDPATDTWLAAPPAAAPEREESGKRAWTHHRIFEDRDTCPVTGTPLIEADVDLAELRSLQDWYLRYELMPLEGVAEVASIGGFVKQYQITIDPVKLLAYDLPLDRVADAIRNSNQDVGGGVLELSDTEYMVRGLGYLGTRGSASGTTDQVLADLHRISLGVTPEGMPILLGDVADIAVGPDARRGILEWNGRGETAGGIVLMRVGENARATIDRVRARLTELEQGLPPGVAIRIGYDRSDLIDRAVGTLRTTLIQEIVVVSLVVLIFLLNVRSTLVAVTVLPLGVLTSLLVMHLMGLSANIMSLGGIAIAIGVMVDSAIIMVENANKRLSDLRSPDPSTPTSPDRRITPSPSREIALAAAEVGPSLFFSLLIITVSFLPVFALGGESGRLFRPLAFTKTFAMAAAAILAVTVLPVLMVYLLPRRVRSEDRNPLSRALQALYEPAFALVMRFKGTTLLIGVLLMAGTLYPLSQLGSEFMPPMDEGDLLYMPTTVEPGLSMTGARDLLQQTDRLLMQFPEVRSVLGKIGRADTATDPAPMNMIETTITLHRDKSRWRHVPIPRFFDRWPAWMQRPLSMVWPTSRPITTDELVYGYEPPGGHEANHDAHGGGPRIVGMNEALQLPGVANAWTMPIRTRIDMLATGIRTPVGVKIMGDDLTTLGDLAEQVARTLRTDADTGPYITSAFAERTTGGQYLDIRLDRAALARHGLSVAQVQEVIAAAVGGATLTQTVEGLERYPVNLRYPRELRDDPAELGRVLVAAPGGAQIPLAQLASIQRTQGPPMVKSENARLTAWVYIDFADLDVGTFVDRAREVVAREIDLPPGTTLMWSGQFESMQEARQRLLVIVPVTLVIIVILLYAATRSWLRVGIVLLAVPFSLIGAIWFIWLLDYNLSVAVWVGLIALAGLDAETGLVMLLYLDNSYERFRREGRMRNAHDLWWAIHDGAVMRIRPKTMTVVTTFTGLLPLMWASGAGADTMRRLAAPMIGGLATSFILELLMYPVLFYLAKRISQVRRA